MILCSEIDRNMKTCIKNTIFELNGISYLFTKHLLIFMQKHNCTDNDLIYITFSFHVSFLDMLIELLIYCFEKENYF